MGKDGSKFYCDNCGKFIGERTTVNMSNDWDVPQGAIFVKKGGVMGFGAKPYVFCSKKCKKEMGL